MRLSISNIGWESRNDTEVYSLMRRYGYTGLEIAPTKIFPDAPYGKICAAREWVEEIRDRYGFVISSMQSIWFGRQEKLFGTEEERKSLADYTKKAVDFAAAIGCKNLVFGCPKNRIIQNETDIQKGIRFFREIGDYAYLNGTVIGMEANPPIYNTNYINDTMSALALIREVDSKGFKLNLDVGTMIYNGEDVRELVGNVNLINHVHISEPRLVLIESRALHRELKDILREEKYQGYISIEIGTTSDLQKVETCMKYIKGVFER